MSVVLIGYVFGVNVGAILVIAHKDQGEHEVRPYTMSP